MGPGTRFEVDIVVNNVEKIWGYQFELGEPLFWKYNPKKYQGWNPSVLKLIAVEKGSFLESAGGNVVWSPGDINNTQGTLSLSLAYLDPNQKWPTGSGVLATLTFEVVGYGQSPIHFGLNTGLLDGQGNWIMRGTSNPEALTDGFFANDLESEPEPETTSVHDVSVAYVRALPSATYPGQTIDIDVIIRNQGGFHETFDVFVYAVRSGDKIRIDIETETVFLDVNTSETLFFIWDTTDVPPGSYWVVAEAVLSEDADPVNNIYYALVGGIYPRYSPKQSNLLDSLASSAIVVLLIGLGMAPVIFFKGLMSQKLWWPSLPSKRHVHNTKK
jgi:hypothetical protein